MNDALINHKMALKFANDGLKALGKFDPHKAAICFKISVEWEEKAIKADPDNDIYKRCYVMFVEMRKVLEL